MRVIRQMAVERPLARRVDLGLHVDDRAGIDADDMLDRVALAGAIVDGDDRYRLLAPFGLTPTGGPIGAAAAQASYWYYQLRDAWRAARTR